MRYLGNDHNIAANAELSATNVDPSQAYYRTDTAAKGGGGVVTLSGDYTGADDATIEVEVVEATGTTRRVTAPTFVGVGSGEMVDISADGTVAPQTITITLEDLGTETRPAYVPFGSATLRAVTAGEGGNDIVVTVDASGLTDTATDYALADAIREGVNEYVGDQWNFGAVTLNAAGELPDGAPRIRFGDDPQVYRPYRRFVDGRYVYSFSPAPVRNAAAGTRVRSVSGAYTLTISDGVTTDELDDGDIVTLYDCLTAIRAQSTLVEVDGVIVRDRTPGGQAVVDLGVRTAPYVQMIERDGSDYVREAEIDIAVDSTAPTETLRIKCIRADEVGAEVWSVRGSSSGVHPDLVTGEAYSDGPYAVTIEEQLPAAAAPGGSLDVQLTPLDRTASAPGFCAVQPTLGANAVNRTYRFVYTARPDDDCDCSTGMMIGGPNESCLGVVPEGGFVATEIPANILSRVQSLYAWLQAFAAGSIDLGTTAESGASAELQIDTVDIQAARYSAGLFERALFRLGEHFDPDAVDSDALDEYDDQFTALQAEFAAIASTDDARAWSTPAGSISPIDELIQTYAQKWELAMTNVLVIAGIDPRDFDDAGTAGSACWRDPGDAYYWQDVSGRLLPMFNGRYYHSARLEVDENGVERVVSTGEFGVGLRIGCPENLQVGDVIEITIADVANPRVTYQVGDLIEVSVVRVTPLQLGGGQTGDDTLVWSVVGSEAGRLDDYALTLDEDAYSDGGLGFTIHRGAIPFALGDRFVLAAEAPQFRWRVDGGTWSADTDIDASVALASGLSAAFASGASPSWVPGDRWTFAVEATHGVGQLRSPGDGRMQWTGSTTIDIVPDDPAQADGLLLAEHTIPSDATITLSASDDDWSTTAASWSVPWAADRIWLPVSATHAAWRITIDRGGSLRWCWLGELVSPVTVTGHAELGRALMRVRLPGLASAAGRGARVSHEFVSRAGLETLLGLLTHASESEDGLLGVLLHAGSGEAGIVRLTAVDIDVTERTGYQRADETQLRHALDLELEPA